PNAVVIIRNGNTVIGSTTASSDGRWIFTPENPLADGTYDFNIVVRDAAGNESVPSDPWTVIVDTSTPLAQATIDSMGKDSGSDRADFLTNDGSAGRLIQGSLTAALAAGEKVQVSVDNGQTWNDAIVGDGEKWMFVDNSSHESSWEIQTRVINSQGNVGEINAQSVRLDTTAPDAPTNIERAGDIVTVSFDSSNLSPGDQITLMIGDYRVDYELEQDDIAAGMASVPIPEGIPSSVDFMAALMDRAGNISQYLSKSRIVENFENVEVGGRWEIDTDLLSITSRPNGSYMGNVPEIVEKDGANMLFFLDSAYPGDINGFFVTSKSEAKSIAFDVNAFGNQNLPGNLDVVVYLSNGQTHSFKLRDGQGVDKIPGKTDWGTFSYEAPDGVIIEKIFVHANDGHNVPWYFDNFSFDSELILVDSPLEQLINDGVEGVYGDGGDNIFLIDNVSDLEGIKAIVGNGGTDTLKLTGEGQVLDLSNLQGKLSSVEVIDLTGTGSNTLKLSLADVLEQGGKDLFVNDGKTQMMIKGADGDVVELSDLLPDGSDVGDWAEQAGTVTVEGVAYNVFYHSGLNAELLVQTGVTTHLENH
ncbi:Ig-like domain-containing protein, partial [Burkholderia ubonensis]|uniref:Ig-like domain-containing protein n=1 Tax=Burkholderia ubonensis TaxID=101571 RepID=UPI000A9AAE5E